MTRALAAFAAYAFAMVCLWAAFHIAPDMKWPRTDIEYGAAYLMILGCVAKFGGHALLMRAANQ